MTIRWRRIVDKTDPPKIKKLIEATGVFSGEEAATAARLAATTVDGTETYRFLLAERDATLLGYTCFDRIELTRWGFDLYWIAVAPEARGTGLALELMERTATFIRGKHGRQIFAETSSREPYAPARAFYRKAGFTEVARFEDFYAAGDDKVIFRMLLA